MIFGPLPQVEACCIFVYPIIRYSSSIYPKKDVNSIHSTAVFQIIRLTKDELALATNMGVELFNTRTGIFSHLTEKAGPVYNDVQSLMNDRSGNIWFSSFNGLSKVNINSKRVTSYGVKDGVTLESFYPASCAGFKNNFLAFGNSKGFVYFNPDKINEPSTPPDVRITGFRVFNKLLSADSIFQKEDAIHLKYTQNIINIEFSSMSYFYNNNLDYYYMLEGIDKDWVLADERREVNYTYLPGGRYIFKVRSVSKDGVPSKHITTCIIYIKPPFWQTGWFYTLCILFAAGIIYAIYRIRIDRLLSMEKVRTRIARDLHDDMGSTLSTINILSTMAKSKVANDPVKTSDYISKISENSSTMMEAMSDIVWSINPQNDSLQKIVARMREFAAGVMEPKNIEYHFTIDEKIKSMKTGLEERRDLFLIFKEGINNLAKYAQCKNVQIEIKIFKKKLYLRIKDDGKGFDVTSADTGNGLNNMQKRAAAMKGKIRIESVPGKGTTLLLEAPIA